MTVTRYLLVEKLSSDVGLSKREAKEFVENFFGEVCKTLSEGRKLKFSGFGSFELRNKRERVGRNPRTGQVAPISARRVVVFRAGQQLKNRVENSSYGRSGFAD